MSVYNCYDDSIREQVGYFKTLDANGNHISYVFWCDVATGEVKRYVGPDESGIWAIGPDRRPVTIHEFHPAPLMFEVTTLPDEIRSIQAKIRNNK